MRTELARIFVAKRGNDDAACANARKEELTKLCGKKTARQCVFMALRSIIRAGLATNSVFTNYYSNISLSFDSTSCKVHQHAAGAKRGAAEAALSADEMKEKQDIGLSRGGKNTKIHALVDGLGNPLRLIFTGGEVHDSKEGVPLLEGFDLRHSAVLGDKAFGTVEILTYIRRQGGMVVIPPKSNTLDPWDCDYCHYKERHLVECFFNKLKHFRRVATRYDKLSSMFQAFAFLACIMIWLN